MKKNEKRMILILIIVVIIIIAILVKVKNGGTDNSSNSNTANSNTSSSDTNTVTENNEEFVEVLEDGTKLNVSSKLSETKTFENYEISNIQLTQSNGQSNILADVKNIGTTDLETTFIEIILLDESGNEMSTMNAVINEVAAGETVQLNASSTVDFANAYDFTINFE